MRSRRAEIGGWVWNSVPATFASNASYATSRAQASHSSFLLVLVLFHCSDRWLTECPDGKGAWTRGWAHLPNIYLAKRHTPPASSCRSADPRLVPKFCFQLVTSVVAFQTWPVRVKIKSTILNHRYNFQRKMLLYCQTFSL